MPITETEYQAMRQRAPIVRLEDVLPKLGNGTYSVFIPAWHPATVNQLLGNHWRAARLKKSDKSIIHHYFRAVPVAKGKRCVDLTIHPKPRCRGADVDAYFKSLLDALVSAKMLVNDCRRWVEISPMKIIRGEIWGTTIELVEME